MNSQRLLLTSVVGYALLAGNLFAQNAAPSCVDMNVATTAIKDKYQAAFKKISDEGDQLNNDFQKPSTVGAAVGVDFKVDMKEQHWIFDIPSVTVKQQDLFFGTPSVTVKDQHIIFDTPSVRMTNVKCGQYPEFHGPFTVVWRDVICGVPQTFMQRQDIVMGVPEFFMQQQHIIMGVPEVTMVRQDWYVKIPEFTLINVHAEISNMQDKADALKKEGEDETSAMRKELTSVIQSGFDCYITSLQNAKSTLAPQMDAAIAQMSSAVSQIRAAGGNPEALGTPPVNVVQQVANLVAQKSEQMSNFDTQITNLLDQEKKAIDKLNAPST